MSASRAFRPDHRSPSPRRNGHCRTERRVIGTLLALGAVTIAATACGSGESGARQASTSPSPVSATVSATPVSASFEVAESSTDIGACFDGECTLTVTGPTTVPVDAAVFGFPEVFISQVTADSVTWQASGPGTFLQGTTGQGGTTTLSAGGSTPITMRPLTFHDNTATVEIFPGNP